MGALGEAGLGEEALGESSGPDSISLDSPVTRTRSLGDITLVSAPTAPSDLSLDSIGETSADLSWTDNSSDEDGFRLQHRKEYDSGFGPWRTVLETNADVTSATDDTVQPGRTYEWRVGAVNEVGVNYSGTVQGSTTSQGVRQTDVPATGWRVEIDHPDGETITPQLLDDPQWVPAVRDTPQVRVPVPQRDSWDKSAWENSTMRVWKGGDRREIDRVEDVEQETGRTILIGRGGTELETRVEVEADNEPVDDFVRTLVDNNTSYSRNVDNPGGSPTEEEVQSADTESEFDTEIESYEDTYPLVVQDSGGEVTVAQTSFTVEAENDSDNQNIATFSDSSYSGGTGVQLGTTTPQWIEWNFSLDHTIPAGDFAVAVRFRTTGTSGVPDLSWSLDGEQISTYSPARSSVDWTQDIISAEGTEPSSDLGSGSHTLRVDVDSTNTESWELDVVQPYDTGGRLSVGTFSYTYDNDNGGSGGYLDGPEFFPDAVDAPMATVINAQATTGARVASTWDDTSNSQAVAVSNDGGKTYTSASNTTSIDHDFGSAGGSAKFKATLSRYGTRDTATPQTGFNGQSVESFTLYADLDDIPILVDETYDGQLGDVLRDIAGVGRSVWEVRRTGETTTTVEWTQPGQRTADVNPAIIDYNVEKLTSEQYTKAVIYGSTEPVSNQTFTADHGNTTTLDIQQLLEGKETVYDTSTGEVFERGSDYEMSYRDAEITTLASGDMDDGVEYTIDYQRRPKGEFEASEFTAGDKILVETVPNVTSNRQAAQAALYLVRRLSDPVYRATLTLSRLDAGRSLIDDLAVSGIPTGERMVPASITQTPGQVVLELESREAVREAIQSLNSQLASTTKRV